MSEAEVRQLLLLSGRVLRREAPMVADRRAGEPGRATRLARADVSGGR